MKEKRDNKIPHQVSGIDKSNEYSVLVTFSMTQKRLHPTQFSTKSHQPIHHNTLESLEALECGKKLLSQLPVVITPWS